jgi:hypothetical protein
MRAINVLLSILITIAIFVLALEGGLRLLGMGPTQTINRFDETLGWSKEPGAVAHRKADEFNVTFEINALGLRDDPMESPEKPSGTFRVVMLGDSFVQGYTVDREDLFVDQLETWWRAEGRSVDVINAGTEAWSTDQEVLWLQENGEAFEPDLVLLFPYENDLFWNSKRSYLRFPKPRFHPEGRVEPRLLIDPGPRPWTDGWAATRLATMFSKKGPPQWLHPSGAFVYGEHAAYFADPPEFMDEAYKRTRGALIALRDTCEELACELYVVPIPNKATFGDEPLASLARTVKVDPALWSVEKPVETVLGMCTELGIDSFDMRPALAAQTEAEGPLYYEKDWHLNPAGNRAVSRFLHDKLDDEGAFMPLYAPSVTAEGPTGTNSGGLPGWLKLYAVLCLLLGVMYTLTYRDEKAWLAPLKIAAFLALIFTIFLSVRQLVDIIPPPFGVLALAGFVLGILTFVLYKLGHRVGTITELFGCFVKRGHWYLMPLVVVLLTIGSLLVVAASSPLIAPFIYTLF